MKWTKKTEQKMLAIISKHKKLQDGFIDAAYKLNTSKSAVANRYYRVMKGLRVDPTGNEEPKSYPWDGQSGNEGVINPPISCEAGAVNYTNRPKIEKPKSFIEKVLAFFKGGKDE